MFTRHTSVCLQRTVTKTHHVIVGINHVDIVATIIIAVGRGTNIFTCLGRGRARVQYYFITVNTCGREECGRGDPSSVHVRYVCVRCAHTTTPHSPPGSFIAVRGLRYGTTDARVGMFLRDYNTGHGVRRGDCHRTARGDRQTSRIFPLAAAVSRRLDDPESFSRMTGRFIGDADGSVAVLRSLRHGRSDDD